jgi:hypothetical protein
MEPQSNGMDDASRRSSEDPTKVGKSTTQVAMEPQSDDKDDASWRGWIGLWLATLISWLYSLLWFKSSSRSTSSTVANQSSSKTSKADRFKEVFSRKDVKVHFVGAWCIISTDLFLYLF